MDPYKRLLAIEQKREDLRALGEMIEALADLSHKGGFTKRQKLKNKRKLLILSSKYFSLYFSLSTLIDKYTPKK